MLLEKRRKEKLGPKSNTFKILHVSIYRVGTYRLQNIVDIDNIGFLKMAWQQLLIKDVLKIYKQLKLEHINQPNFN